MRKLSCDKDGCKRAVYYVEEACDGIEQELCKKHGDEYTIKESLPGKICYLKHEIRKTSKRLKCQNSKDGHTFPPFESQKPPWESNHDAKSDTYIDLAASSTFSFMTGYPHTCTKCGYTYYDPSGLLNISELSFNVADTLQEIDTPKLVMNLPFPRNEK